MKKLLAVCSALLSSAAIAATLSPIQLLNPAGSTAGQAIVSTGATTPPAWGAVGLVGIGPIAANSVLSNATGSTAAPTAFAMPSCSGANNALRWSSGTGFTCANSIALTSSGLNQFATTTSAQLATIVSDETGSGALVFGTSPTIASPTVTGTMSAAAITASGLITPSSVAGIKGTTTNDNAQAGSWGEFPTPTNQSGISITSGTPLNVSQATLAAGDYEITASACFTGAASTVGTYFQIGVSTTSATFGPFPQNTTILGVSVTGANGVLCISSPPVRESLASATTIYAVAESFFSTSTMTVSGNLHIRRAR